MSQSNLLKSYDVPPPPGGPPGQVEAWALSQAALRMKNATETNDAAKMAMAVRLNWRLWTIFQGDLLDPQCVVPDDVRSNLLSLSNFVDKHTVTFLADHDLAKIDRLIAINRELAGGLFEGQRADAAQANAKPQDDSGGAGDDANPGSLKIST